MLGLMTMIMLQQVCIIVIIYNILLICNTIVGDLCQLTESSSSQTTRESCSTLEAYIDTLITPDSCSTGQPGILIWSPDHNTPDLVYYQVLTLHMNTVPELLNYILTIVCYPFEPWLENPCIERYSITNCCP